jgi:hypothetical protein
MTDEEEAQDKLKWINDRIVGYWCDTLDNYVCIAGALEDLKNSSLYTLIRRKDGTLGYNNVYDLIKEQWGYSKSTVNNYISVAKRFGCRFSAMKAEYKGYDFSQLVEMLSLDNTQLSKVSPQMTCAEIRKLKSENKPDNVTDFTPAPNCQLLVQFSQDLFERIRNTAKSEKISMVDFVVHSVRFYLNSVLLG